MDLQQVIIETLKLKKSLTLKELLQEVSAQKQNFTSDLILEMIRRMKGKAIVRVYSFKQNDYLYNLNSSDPSIPARKRVVKSSACEVIARQILKGANIEEAAAHFTCRPLTIIRKVQQFCMTRDPDLYMQCIESNRKTADIDKLRQKFVQYIQ
jgi:hypothetical protein